MAPAFIARTEADVAMSRHNDDGQSDTLRSERFLHFKSVHAGHADVEEDTAAFEGRRFFQDFGAVCV